MGCYWAGPFVIKVYDFKEPLQLPLRERCDLALLDASEVLPGGLDEAQLVTNRRTALPLHP
ncbi:MAG: hypothetical protein AAFW73_12700 [Bacteroidota bacterium]